MTFQFRAAGLWNCEESEDHRRDAARRCAFWPEIGRPGEAR
jgi:uncharacterized protein YaeQ